MPLNNNGFHAILQLLRKKPHSGSKGLSGVRLRHVPPGSSLGEQWCLLMLSWLAQAPSGSLTH